MHGFIGLMFMAAYMAYADDVFLIISMVWIAAGAVVYELGKD
jgi:hypothetical protein